MSDNLRSHLLKLLPKNTKAFKTKDDFEKTKHNKFKKTKAVLPKANFIRFNTVKTTKILVYDIDKFPHFSKKPCMREYLTFFKIQTGINPTYILQTDKGYHIGIALKNLVFTEFKSGLETANHHNAVRIKKEITSLLSADVSASHRMYGIFRNPTTHPHYYTNIEYEIDELLNLLNLPYEKPNYKYANSQKSLFSESQMPSQSKKLKLNEKSILHKWIKDGYIIGNRNNYLFALLYKNLYENRSTTDEELETIAQSTQDAAINKLNQKEVEDIINNVIKMKKTMYKSNGQHIFKPGKYWNEMWELSIHGKKNRQKFAQEKTSEKRREKTLSLIVANSHMNIKDLSIKINRSIKTIKKYKNIYNIKLLTLLSLLKPSTKIDIRANFSLLFKEEKKRLLDEATINFISPVVRLIPNNQILAPPDY